MFLLSDELVLVEIDWTGCPVWSGGFGAAVCRRLLLGRVGVVALQVGGDGRSTRPVSQETEPTKMGAT